MASNGEWGDSQDTTQQQKVFEEFEKYDSLEMTPALQKFLDAKGLRFEDLQRIGTRQTFSTTGELTLVYQFPDGLKFRTLSGIRWASKGTEWNLAKRIRSGIAGTKQALVVEGETDAALMSRIMPSYDIYILPAGARYVSDAIIAQLKRYETVYVGLDNDEAGKLGSKKILDSLASAASISPPEPAKDWCEAGAKGLLLGWKPEPQKSKVVFTFGEILDTDFGSFNENNWFEQPILPVAGQLMIHAEKKSLKSFILLELIRAITTGTDFAGYYQFVREQGPGKVLLLQMEILPLYFQLRLLSYVNALPVAMRDLFRKNAVAYGIGDNRLPRIRVTDKDFRSKVYRALNDSEAEVVVFDPIQRLTGEADVAKVNEMDILLDFYSELQSEGFTVVAAHHNTKSSGGNSRDPNSMVGTQRFSGDADSICSVWHDPTVMVADGTDLAKKQRNFTWTLRNGAAPGRSITVTPDAIDEHLVTIEFGELLTLESEDFDDPGAPGFL